MRVFMLSGMLLNACKIAIALTCLVTTCAFSPSSPGHSPQTHSRVRVSSRWAVRDREHVSQDVQAISMSENVPGVGRREILLGGAAAAFSVSQASPAEAVVGGTKVTSAEAAEAGVVGLYIDLERCQICRPGEPGVCTGMLVGPDLVLSAKHCSDIPLENNGTLSKIVFGADFKGTDTQFRNVVKYVTTSDYGIDSAGNDLLLIKMDRPAPEPWKPVALPIRLLPKKGERAAAKAAKSLLADGLGLPSATAFGYGVQDPAGDAAPVERYKTGELKRLGVNAQTEVSVEKPGWLVASADEASGLCSGDSGGAAMVNIGTPDGKSVMRLSLGVLTANSNPCKNNQGIFIFPQYFDNFLLKASKDLGSPLQPGYSWRDYKSR